MGMNAADGRWLKRPDHISQSLGKILATPIGSRVMRRDFGSLIPALIDQPLNAATILRTYSAAVVAIQQWEPRIKITEVRRAVTTDGKFALEIHGQDRKSGEPFNTTVPAGGAQ